MKKGLIFLNEVPDKSVKTQDYVKETITDFFNSLKLDISLKVKFVKIDKQNEFEITDCYVKNISEKKYELLIDNSVVKTIHADGGVNFVLSVYHEFEHIRDYANMMKTRLFNFNLCLAHQKDYEKEYVSTGFLFWTEVCAYSQTIEFAKDENLHYEKITFGNLVKCYLKTVNFDKKIYYNKNLTYDEADKYIKSVDSFIYLCAKYMASVYVGHSKVPYFKIDKDKNYKKVYSILRGFEPKVMRLGRNPYSPKSYDNLFKLGKYICENVRWKIFKVGLTKLHRKIFSFY